MYHLQKVYSLVLNQFFVLTKRIDERIRNAIITLCCLFLSGFFILYYDRSKPFGLYLQHTRNNLICGVVLGILVIFSIKAPLKKVKWDRCLFYLFFLAGAGIVAISVMHPIGNGYRSFGLMLMVGFPCLYYVWNNRGDYDVLYTRLAIASSITGLLFACFCGRLAILGELNHSGGRVEATFFNANMFSMVGMAMACSAIYMFSVNKQSRLWFLFSAIAYATGWDIVLLGASRISMAVCAGGTIALFIYSFKTDRMLFPAVNNRSCISRLAVLAITLFIVVMTGSMLMSRNLAISYMKSTGLVDSDQTIKTEDIKDKQDEIPDEVIDHNKANAIDRFGTDGKDLNMYTAGRITIWRGYASHLNMWGNDFSKTDFKELTGTDVQHAHNNLLEYAYRCGVPVACIHIILEFYAGIICIVFLFSKKYKEPYSLFAIVFMICYAFESMFDIATLPFERHAPFYFYMALIPVFGRLSDKGEGEQNASNS